MQRIQANETIQPKVSSRKIVEYVDLLYDQEATAVVNMQHDCIFGHCKQTQQQPIRQEREVTTLSRKSVLHTYSDDSRFVLNLSAIHNHSHTIRAVPVHLRERPVLVEDSHAIRLRAARILQEKNRDGQKGPDATEKSATAEDGDAEEDDETIEVEAPELEEPEEECDNQVVIEGPVLGLVWTCSLFKDRTD